MPFHVPNTPDPGAPFRKPVYNTELVSAFRTPHVVPFPPIKLSPNFPLLNVLQKWLLLLPLPMTLMQSGLRES